MICKLDANDIHEWKRPIYAKLRSHALVHLRKASHAGGVAGWLSQAELIFKSKSNTGYYHNEVNATHFLEWFENKYYYAHMFLPIL